MLPNPCRHETLSTQDRAPAPRLCFGWYPDIVRHAGAAAMPGQIGQPAAPVRDAFALQSRPGTSFNRGYLVIGEATSRMLVCDPDGSAVVDLRRLAATPGETAGIAAHINRHFDALILGMAYEIGAERDLTPALALLERIHIPIVTLGLAIEHADLAGTDIHDSVRGVLGLLSERAALFGVRAHSTLQWLEGNGFRRSVPLGCPTLHLYPDAILGMERLGVAAGQATFASGGYLFRHEARSRALADLFAGHRADYIMQDELSALSDEELRGIAWRDGARELSADDLNRVGERRLGYRLPFRRYYLFDDMPSWRQGMSRYDAYVGDRFHGATVALQLGKPTVVLAKDVRSQELCEFYRLPSTTLDRAVQLGLDGAIEEVLSAAALDRMKETYLRRTAALSLALKSCGLGLCTPPRA